MKTSILALLVPLAFLASIATAAGGDAHAPLAVAAVEADGTAFVAWVPGEVPADAYRVYGLRDGAAVLLYEAEEAAVPFALVPGGFATYAVTGVRDGAESSATTSGDVDGGWCILKVYFTPELGWTVCKLPLPSKVQLPVAGRFLP